MNVTVEPCVMGHDKPGAHTPGCPCATDHNDQHPDHCKGCGPALATRESGYCAWHEKRITTALTAIPDLTAHIEASPDGRVARRSVNSAADRKPTKVDQASPSPAWDAADDAITWAWTWAETATPTRGNGPFTWNRAGLPTRDLTRTCGYLHTHLNRISREPYAADFATEALNLHRQLELYAGTDRLTHRIKARCPSCDMKTLTRDDGADQIECRNPDCRRIWREDEYATFAHVAAS